MKLAQLIPLILPTLLLVACTEQVVESVEQDLVRPAKIFEVKDSGLQLIRTFPAAVEPHQGSLLAFRVSGELQELNVLAGQEVKKGQLLAKLDPEDFLLQLDDRKARFELAKSQFARMQTLLASKQVSPSQFDQAKADTLIAESELKKAQSNLEYSQLRAPFAGSVSQLYVENYENVVAKQSILFLQNQDLLDVTIQVPEGIIARVQKDTNYQPSVTFDSYADQSYLLTVKEWDTKADPATLTYKVVFSLPKPADFNLLPGMTGTVKIDLSKVTSVESSGLIVPVEAVFSPSDNKLDADNRYVWLYNDANGSISKTKVTVGNIYNSGIEILTGLKPGDKVVTAGGHYLREGMRVRPWTRERGL